MPRHKAIAAVAWPSNMEGNDAVAHGLRVALLVVRMGHHKRLAAQHALRQRVAELLAVVMICDRRRIADLEDLETRHKLAMLSAYAASC